MTSVAAHHLLLTNKNLTFHFSNNTYTSKHSNRGAIPFLPSKPLSRQSLKTSRLHSGNSSNTSHEPKKTPYISPETLLLFLYFIVFLCLRILFVLLPPDFSQRWHHLIASSEYTEANAKDYPSHLWKAIVAYEDRRFFRHCGIDPVGIARAVLFFPHGGGGSTITQQLVKNTFLKNDRTFSRKAVELILALILERTLSKTRILSSYLSKIYLGHGIYGIESASNFYFGKHPSLLSLGESAMLAGIIPAPELRSPFNDPSRGKASQARALRRMVDAGFLDIEAALSTMNQPLHLCRDRPQQPNSLMFLVEEPRDSRRREEWKYTVKDIWDWERESKIWEVREDMERWLMRIREEKN